MSSGWKGGDCGDLAEEETSSNKKNNVTPIGLLIGDVTQITASFD